MKVDLEKPGTPGDILTHHGVKGMHWGVRKREEVAAIGESTKRYMLAANKLKAKSPVEVRARLKENSRKSLNKFVPSEADDSHKGLTSKQKKILLGVGIGVVAVGVVGGAYYLKTHGESSSYIKDYRKLAGKPISPEKFKEMATVSRNTAWGHDTIFTKEAFARPEFELPTGNTFYRISSETEKSFGHATYTSPDARDFNRYIAHGFAGQMTTHDSFMKLVQFKSTRPIKVPTLSTVLNTIKELNPHMSDTEVLDHYGRSITDYSLTAKGKPLFEALKAKGYSAIVDEHDAGIVGEHPLVFFAPEHATQKVSSTITKEMMKSARDSLIELQHRKL